jgi:hypothetical protein
MICRGIPRHIMPIITSGSGKLRPAPSRSRSLAHFLPAEQPTQPDPSLTQPDPSWAELTRPDRSGFEVAEPWERVA